MIQELCLLFCEFYLLLPLFSSSSHSIDWYHLLQKKIFPWVELQTKLSSWGACQTTKFYEKKKHKEMFSFCENQFFISKFLNIVDVCVLWTTTTYLSHTEHTPVCAYIHPSFFLLFTLTGLDQERVHKFSGTNYRAGRHFGSYLLHCPLPAGYGHGHTASQLLWECMGWVWVGRTTITLKGCSSEQTAHHKSNTRHNCLSTHTSLSTPTLTCS